MFSAREFEVAFNKAKSKHQNISRALGESVLKKFVMRWENNRNKPRFQREQFGELIRLTLNEISVSGQVNRQMYSALIGHYYSAHAVYVKARQKESGHAQQKSQPSQAPIGVLQGNNGQFAWQI